MAEEEKKEILTLESFIEKINGYSKEQINYEQLLELIDKIAQMHRTKSFSYFSEEDIESQVKLICIQQLIYYEPHKGLGVTVINSIERWLNKVVKNRLANYYRDNYSSVNERHKKTRASLNNCIDIDLVHATDFKSNVEHFDPTYNLRYIEFKDFVESRLNEELLDIYHACLDDENVSSYYKSKLNQQMSKIVDEWNDKEKD